MRMWSAATYLAWAVTPQLESQKLPSRLQAKPYGGRRTEQGFRAISFLVSHLESLRFHREDGRYSRFLLYETPSAERKLRRLEPSPLDSKTKNSRLADPPVLPSSL